MRVSHVVAAVVVALGLAAFRGNAQDAAPLPGRGLAQHSFLYSGEFDTRKPVQTMFPVKERKVAWTYEIPTNDANKNLSEFSDVQRRKPRS